MLCANKKSNANVKVISFVRCAAPQTIKVTIPKGVADYFYTLRNKSISECQQKDPKPGKYQERDRHAPIFGEGDERFDYPLAFIVDPEGNLYFGTLESHENIIVPERDNNDYMRASWQGNSPDDLMVQANPNNKSKRQHPWKGVGYYATEAILKKYPTRNSLLENIIVCGHYNGDFNLSTFVGRKLHSVNGPAVIRISTNRVYLEDWEYSKLTNEESLSVKNTRLIDLLRLRGKELKQQIKRNIRWKIESWLDE